MGFWDSIKNFASNVWGKVKNVASDVWGRVSPIIRMLPLGNKIASGVESVASGINSGANAIGALSQGKLGAAAENIREAYNKGKEGVEKLATMKKGGKVMKMFQKTK